MPISWKASPPPGGSVRSVPASAGISRRTTISASRAIRDLPRRCRRRWPAASRSDRADRGCCAATIRSMRRSRRRLPRCSGPRRRSISRAATPQMSRCSPPCRNRKTSSSMMRWRMRARMKGCASPVARAFRCRTMTSPASTGRSASGAAAAAAAIPGSWSKAFTAWTETARRSMRWPRSPTGMTRSC